MTPSDKAREMLAAELDAAGWDNAACRIRTGADSFTEEAALRAIDKAWNEAVAECARVAEAKKKDFGDPRYAGGTIGAFGEIFACNQIADAIRALARPDHLPREEGADGR